MQNTPGCAVLLHPPKRLALFLKSDAMIPHADDSPAKGTLLCTATGLLMPALGLQTGTSYCNNRELVRCKRRQRAGCLAFPTQHPPLANSITYAALAHENPRNIEYQKKGENCKENMINLDVGDLMASCPDSQREYVCGILRTTALLQIRLFPSGTGLPIVVPKRPYAVGIMTVNRFPSRGLLSHYER